MNIRASGAEDQVRKSRQEGARKMGVGPLACLRTVTLPPAASGLIAGAIFVLFKSLYDATGAYFAGMPDVITQPSLIAFLARPR